MTVGALLYEGKAKKVFATDKPDQVVQYFKDDATAFNAQKRGTIVEKGVINNKVSERLFRLLEQAGVPTHFVERLSDRELLTKKVTIVPVEVVVRNVVAGSLAKRLGLKEGRCIGYGGAFDGRFGAIEKAVEHFWIQAAAQGLLQGQTVISPDRLRCGF